MVDDLFPPASRADQIFERFRAFHEANPKVWELFKRYALDLVSRGRGHYGAASIIERIRWHLNIETTGDEVKINNDFCAYYARMFMANYPQHDGFFEIRRRLSADRPSCENDSSVFYSGRVLDETHLMAALRMMA